MLNREDNPHLDWMRGHTTTGRRESDEIATVPHIQRNGSRGGSSGEESRRHHDFWLDDNEEGNSLEGGDELRPRVVRRRSGGDRCGSRVRRLHATGGNTAVAGGLGLAELLDGRREGREVREHQCEAEKDGYYGLHRVVSVVRLTPESKGSSRITTGSD